MKNCSNLKVWLMPLMVVFLMGNVARTEAQTVRIVNSNPKGGGGVECEYKKANDISVYILVQKTAHAEITSIEIEGIDDQVTSQSIQNLGAADEEYNLFYYNFGLINDLEYYTGTSSFGGGTPEGISYTFDFNTSSGSGTLSSSLGATSFTGNIQASFTGMTINHSSVYCDQGSTASREASPEKSDIIDVAVSPNPASSHVKIEIRTSNVPTISIDILNELGQQVSSYSLEVNPADEQTSQKEIDISNLAKGIYYIRLMSKEEIQTKKIIKI